MANAGLQSPSYWFWRRNISERCSPAASAAHTRPVSVTSKDALVLPVDEEDPPPLLLLPLLLLLLPPRDDAPLEVSTLELLPVDVFPLDAPRDDATKEELPPAVDVVPPDDVEDVLEPALMHSRTLSSGPGAHW